LSFDSSPLASAVLRVNLDAIAFRPQPALAAYAASKGALISLAKALARELAADKIRVNCVCPGLVQTSIAKGLKESVTDDQFAALTKQYPLGIGTPLDVSYAIAFLLAPAARGSPGPLLSLTEVTALKKDPILTPLFSVQADQ